MRIPPGIGLKPRTDDVAYLNEYSGVQILENALYWFGNRNFDYFGAAQGYSESTDAAGVHSFGAPTDCEGWTQIFLNKESGLYYPWSLKPGYEGAPRDGRPDVNCGSVVDRALWITPTNPNDRPPDYNWEPVPVSPSKLKLGDVFFFTIGPGETSVVWPGGHTQPLQMTYEHTGFVASEPEQVKGGQLFRAFHSMEREVGPTELNWFYIDSNGNVKMYFGVPMDVGTATPVQGIEICWGHECPGFEDDAPAPPNWDPNNDLTGTMNLDHLKWDKGVRYVAWSEIPKVKSPSKASVEAKLRDPLVLDLTGSGIQTYGADSGTYFDFNNSGFAERSGWVSPEAGLLMLDMNGNGQLDNGTELFGNFMILPDGRLAQSGFQALAYYDANHDGQIDANDPIWSQLKVFANSQSRLFTAGIDGELYTPDELGIGSINLASTEVNTTDDSGNTVLRAGHFVWSDGATGTMADYSLQQDPADTMATDVLDVPDDIAALPDLQGYGNVHDLQQAMVRDSSGQLTALVEAFTAEENPADRSAILTQLIFKWTGTDVVASSSIPFAEQWAKVYALEKLYGTSFSGREGNGASGVAPGGGGLVMEAPPWNYSYDSAYFTLFEFFYSDLMGQTHLRNLFDKISFASSDAGRQP
ncbi:MAG: hypothetical protein AB1646_21680 [Thermodesulfobacteriota bacterium]